jgi:hypothetical protein
MEACGWIKINNPMKEHICTLKFIGVFILPSLNINIQGAAKNWKKIACISVKNTLRISILVLLLGAGEKSWGQLFQQDFSISTTVSDYVNAAPTNGQFNAIGTSGAGTVLSINTAGSNKLRFARTANAGSYSRTTDFSPIPTSLMYRFDLTVSANSVAQTTAAVWQVGSAYGTANSAESNANTHSRFGLNLTSTAGQFSIRDIGASVNSTNYTGTQTITWIINNSGVTLTYKAPDGSFETVADDKADLWIGTTKEFNEISATTTTQTLSDLKFAFTAGSGTVDIDNILIDPIPLIPTSNAASSITASGFTANWTTVSGVTGYRLDVATDAAFTSMVPGYSNLYIAGQATSSQAVSGLSPNTPYFYRVRGASQYVVGEFASGNSGSQNPTTLSTSPSLSINNISQNELNAGTSIFQFTVSLTLPAPPGGVTFDIATADNTATTANNDYVSNSLTGQTIPAGFSTYTFDVTVNGDLCPEPNETFFVNVTNVTGATLMDAQGQGTIQNDDNSPSITVTETSGTQNDGFICSGSGATLTASLGTAYLWSNNETTPSYICVAGNNNPLHCNCFLRNKLYSSCHEYNYC